MYVLNKLNESHGTHLSPFIQVGPRATKYLMEKVFEGAIIFYIEKHHEGVDLLKMNESFSATSKTP